MLMPERLNTNRYIAFPFVEDARRVAVSGTVEVQLPLDFLVDAYLCVYAQEVTKVSLTGVTVAGGGDSVTLVFACEYEGGAFNISVLVASAYSEYMEADTFNSGVYHLTVTAGPGLKDFAVAYPGLTFTVSDCMLEPSRIHVRDKHVVRTVTAIGGRYGTTSLSGAVRVLPGYNVLARVQASPARIVLGAAKGEGMGEPCEQMLSEPSECNEYVYSINGVEADLAGRLILSGKDGVAIEATPGGNTVTISVPYKLCPPGCRSEI